MKDSFVLYTRYKKQIELLDMVQRGLLLTAIFCHESGETLPEMDATTSIAYSFIEADLEENAAKYEARCKANKANGDKGGRPKKEEDGKPKKTQKTQSVISVSDKTERFSEKPKKPDNDNDNDDDYENVSSPTDVVEDSARACEQCPAIPLNNGTEWRPTAAEFENLTNAFPDVDINQALWKIRAWVSSGKHRKRSPFEIGAYVYRWIRRDQDDAGAKDKPPDDIPEATEMTDEELAEFFERKGMYEYA